jgi:hypothetical protein
VCERVCIHAGIRSCLRIYTCLNIDRIILHTFLCFIGYRCAYLISSGGVRLSPLGTSATNCGAVGGMRIGRGNRNYYMALQPFVGPSPLFQFLDPIHSR